jgi:hypothetical protein
MAHYRLLALDVDGTLVGPDQVVSDEAVQAVAEAAGAGLRVCIATGRSHVESIGVWRQLRLRPPYEPMILVGGALVAEPDTARTLRQWSIPLPVTCEFAEALNELGYVAMVLVDRWRWGVDYLLTERGDHHAARRDWLAKMDVRVRRVRRLADRPEAADALRISTVADAHEAPATAAGLQTRFEGRLNVRCIFAPNYGVTVVEAHVAAATKLAAVRYVAQARRIGAARIAAIGDDVNDLPMIRGVGLGAAMPHAPKELRDAAGHVATDGLAAFVRGLAAGQFDP